MAGYQITRYIRPIEEVAEHLVKSAQGPGHPWPPYTRGADAQRIFGAIHSLDRDEWARAFMAVAAPYEAAARAAEGEGHVDAATENYQLAYAYYRMGRYPTKNSPQKQIAYAKSVEMYLNFAKYLDPPVERVVMPLPSDSSKAVIGYLRRPRGTRKTALVVRWGGIDSFKEEWNAASILARNLAMLAIDMPGVGEAPLAGSETAETMFDAVFDWIAQRPDLDADRVGIMGGSTGGYWSAKLAHTHRERIRAAVDWGGCAHFAFTPEWIEQAQHGEYPLELAETLTCAFGLETFDEWVDYAPRLSLLDQGILDQPSAPMLLINGIHDTIFPIADMYLLLEHGAPKSARFFDLAHMARGPHTEPLVLDWLEAQLR